MHGAKNKASVRILQDTGAAQSFILQSVLPLSDATKTGTSVQGFEMGFTVVPLHHIQLHSIVISGTVAVGVRQSLPIPGLSFILGNDI